MDDIKDILGVEFDRANICEDHIVTCKGIGVKNINLSIE